MKKLYLISYYFAPLGRADGVNRTYLVKYLAELGWDIEVISCQNPHAFLRNFQKDYSLLDLLPSSVKLHRIESFYWGPLGSFATFLGLSDDPFGNWYYPVLKQVDQIVTEPGIIYAIAPPSINVKLAAKIARDKSLPLVIDFRDDTFNLPVDIIRNATGIVASTDTSLKNMQTHYQLAPKTGVTIYNGFPVNTPGKPVSSNLGSDRLHIIYAGLLNLDQDPALLAQAIQLLEKRYPQIRGHITVDYYGPSNYYTTLILKKYLSDTVRFKGYVPFQTVLEEIAKADLAYLSLKDDNKAYCIPSKAFQYISMETPILATGPNGAMQAFVNQHGIGRFSDSRDLLAQAEDILFFLENKPARLEAIENIRQLKPSLSMQSQVSRLDQYLRQLAR